MNFENLKEILKKSFGKEKDNRTHAIAMLAIYGIIFTIVIVMIRISGVNKNETNTSYSDKENITTPSNTNSDYNTNNDSASDKDDNTNYSYSYTIYYNDEKEIYLGNKNGNKERFTLMRDNTITEYAIIGDNYLILDNGTYHITKRPSNFLKYCSIDTILLVIENEISTTNANTIKYNISNSDLSRHFKDSITNDNNRTNLITLTFENDDLKSIDLDLSNYLTSVKNEETSLNIHMEYVDVGTTEDFEIKIS